MQSYTAKDDKRAVLFMLIGLPGSGKSYYAQNLRVIRNNETTTPTIYSSDELRKELFGDYDVQDKNDELFNELHNRIRTSLKTGHDTVYDATNIKKKERTNFLNTLTDIPCHKVAIVFAKDVKTCQDQNNKREKKVPEKVITRMWMHWSPPDYIEGFDEIQFITPTMTKAYYDMNTLLAFLDNIGQKNHHHTLTIGGHCRKAALIATEEFHGDDILKLSALLHDIGKLYTATFKKPDGTVDDECHYYNHEKVGSYEAMLYLDKYVPDVRDKVMILNLIYQHMLPTHWVKHPELKEKHKAKFGEELINYLEKLHICDYRAK